MTAGYTISYSNNWKGHPYKRLRVVNNPLTNEVCMIWWDIDKFRHINTIGEWKVKLKTKKK